MDRKPRAFLLGGLRDLAHEGEEVGAQIFDPDLIVARERALKLWRS